MKESSPSDPKPTRARYAEHAGKSGVLWASATAPLVIATTSVDRLPEAARWMWLAGALASLLLLAAARSIDRHTLWGRRLATAGGGLAAVLAGPSLITSPFATLVVLVAGTLALRALWREESIGAGFGGATRPFYESQALGAAIATVALWLVWVWVQIETSTLTTAFVAWSFAVTTALAVEWAIRNRQQHRRRALAVVLVIAVAAAIAAGLWHHWWWLTSSLAMATTALIVILLRPVAGADGWGWWESMLGRPERLFIGTFVGLCTVGTVLLMLPQSTVAGESIGLLDAAFTSTSAVCVTGLIVLDTPTVFSGFGQLVVLLLIQVGGLGIMTFSTAALWALGHRLSLRHEGAVASLISTEDRGRLFISARQILLLTLGVEAIGALWLTGLFAASGEALGSALWRGVFTSISAFCNAGFALQSDSLVPFQQSPMVLHGVAVLIVAGGLSPLVVLALPDIVRPSAKPVSAQARLALAATVVLLVVGFFFFLAFEWHGSLQGLPFADRIHNAWFQSVTLRTAGFNSIDLTAVGPATITMMLLWMFVGGNPGGTAGGIKTTTVSILLLSVVEAMRGRWTLDVFGKRISERSRHKAAVIVAVAAFIGVVALLVIQLTQQMPTQTAVFEVVSALGTVGLSIGGTAELDSIGKIAIILCMFVGRVGGLTLLMFLSSRDVPPALGHPEEHVAVG